VLDLRDAVAQVELALLEPLYLQHVGTARILERADGGVEVAVLLMEPRQLLPQLAFFLFAHRHRGYGPPGRRVPIAWKTYGFLPRFVQVRGLNRSRAKRGFLRCTMKTAFDSP